MDQGVIYSEKQRFKQWWLWLIILGLNGFFIYEIYNKATTTQDIGFKSLNISGIVIVLLFILLLNILFYVFRLETQITTKGIYVRLFPLNLKFKFYAWEDLSKTYIREYSPLKEFGGWGIRYGLQGIAYTVSGSKGLQLELSDAKKILIGTNKPKELNDVLIKFDKLRP